MNARILIDPPTFGQERVEGIGDGTEGIEAVVTSLMSLH